MARRGFTLLELLLAAMLTVLVVSTLTLLYGFTFNGVANSATTFATNDQASQVLETVAETASQAISCTTVTSGQQTALKCTMPAAATATDADGYPDTFQPSSTSRRGVERYLPGVRIWYYFSDDSGAFGASGTTLWRAKRTDDSPPTAPDADALWTFYGGSGRQRHGLISSLSFGVSGTSDTVTITVASSSLLSTERRPSSGQSPPQTMTVTVSRVVQWRNGLQ
jgi:type II secretory pathway pseudopilin PulG